jgi:catechol 2,3-dioxygenase-like lactoylglutathione lyase family enzyme
MFSHVTVGTNDMPRAQAFYDKVMATLDHGALFKVDEAAAYGDSMTGPKIFVLYPFDKGKAAPGNGMHIAFLAKSRAAVDAFHAAALEMGGTSEGEPGLRPHYHPNYYGAYVRDPDGNKLQAVCHSSKG